MSKIIGKSFMKLERKEESEKIQKIIFMFSIFQATFSTRFHLSSDCQSSPFLAFFELQEFLIEQKLRVVNFNFMQIEEASLFRSFDRGEVCQATPSTSGQSQANQNERHEPDVQEFNLSYDVLHLTKMMSGSSLNEKQNQKHVTDRFIPIRKTSSNRVQQFGQNTSHVVQKKSSRGVEIGESKITIGEMYKMLLLQKSDNKLLSFGQQSNKNGSIKNNIFKQSSQKFFNAKNIPKRNNIENRKINKAPFKVLDAPNLQDDFYLNLLQWSSQNILSVALDSSLYMWNGNNNKVIRFCDINPSSITSLTWNEAGSQISIGNNQGITEIWDLQRNAKIIDMYGHNARVSSLSWTGNLLASGSRDRTINIHDTRMGSRDIVSIYQGHTQQVCGLKWSFDGQSLASGGNDNKLMIWNTHSTVPVNKFSQHCAAVKGLAWNPHNHGVLASGGGSADRTIKFWNTLDGTMLDSIDTGSQICNLIFSKTTKEFVSTHGYSNNEIVVWKYPTLEKITTLTGHTSRVLFLAMNPSGETIVTGAGDQTLRFWNVFPSSKQSSNLTQNMFSSMVLR